MILISLALLLAIGLYTLLMGRVIRWCSGQRWWVERGNAALPELIGATGNARTRDSTHQLDARFVGRISLLIIPLVD